MENRNTNSNPSSDNSCSSGSSDTSGSANSRSSKPSQRESVQVPRQSCQMETKKAENELKVISQNPAVIILSGWLKVRNTLKTWSKTWCVLYPGMLILYKSAKQNHWIGTAILASVEIIERPSKKHGKCFKIFSSLSQSIWASKGPKRESPDVLATSLPGAHLIIRADSNSDGQCWIDALELSRDCSNLLKKSLEDGESPMKALHPEVPNKSANEQPANDDSLTVSDLQQNLIEQLQRPAIKVEETEESDHSTSSESNLSIEGITEEDDGISTTNDEHLETPYVSDGKEELGESGESSQTEELAGENKSIIWTLLKQIRPGMDLSKIVLPTFILEPRSFLDKLSDYYYHSDLLSVAAQEKTPFDRIKAVTQWYLSGFYKKPKGLKKPYNPILGEVFRCQWKHPKTESTTFFIAEQVSHHPPISAVVVINRKDGFMVSGSILTKSKFYGNSVSAMLDGTLKVSLLNQGEEYFVTLPYAHCKGILYGKMTMEFGGKVQIVCDKTGYSTEVEFKLKRMFGSSRINELSGRILLGSRVLATLSGCWDTDIHLTQLSEGSVSAFWSPSSEIKDARLIRYTVAPMHQKPYESAKLWQHVTAAINKKDQQEATNQKGLLEDQQRMDAKERAQIGEVWVPRYFKFDDDENEWYYKFMDARPWDDLNDIEQYEYNFVISNKTVHKTTPVRNTIPGIVHTHLERTSHRRMSMKTQESEAARRRSIDAHGPLSEIRRLSHVVEGQQSGTFQQTVPLISERRSVPFERQHIHPIEEHKPLARSLFIEKQRHPLATDKRRSLAAEVQRRMLSQEASHYSMAHELNTLEQRSSVADVVCDVMEPLFEKQEIMYFTLMHIQNEVDGMHLQQEQRSHSWFLFFILLLGIAGGVCFWLFVDNAVDTSWF